MVFDKFSRHGLSLRSSAQPGTGTAHLHISQYRDCSSTHLTVQGLLIYTSHSTGTAHLHISQYRDCSSTHLTVQGLLIYTSHSTGTAHLHISQYRSCSSTHPTVLKLRRIDFLHSHRRAVRRILYSLDPLNNEPLPQRFPTRQTIDCGQDRCQPCTHGGEESYCRVKTASLFSTD